MDDNVKTAESVNYTELTADLVAAYVAHNPVPVAGLMTLIASLHAALTELGSPEAAIAATVTRITPARIRKSIQPDALISFEDGKPYKTLKRHLSVSGLDPEAYRQKWGLPRDYPMVAASYSEARSAMAKSIGLGRKPRKAAPQVAKATDAAEKPKRVGRPRKA